MYEFLTYALVTFFSGSFLFEDKAEDNSPKLGVLRMAMEKL